MGAQMRAFIWRHGILQNMGTLGGPDSCALWINENGQAAGHSYINSTVNPAFGFPTQDPFLWDHDKMIDLGTLGGFIGVANGLNNRGQVVGASDLEGDLTAHPFLWDRGSLMDLGTLGGTFGVATSVNDGGEVVGGATNKNDQAFLAFLWKRGVMTDLGSVEGDDCSRSSRL
jgi:probable HAF family extracellular repeat protein